MMTETEEKYAQRIANALEMLAVNLSELVAMKQANVDNQKQTLDLLTGAAKTFMEAAFTRFTGAPWPSDTASYPAPESMPNGDHLCRCAHPKEQHVQGDGPCVNRPCICESFDGMAV